MFFGELQEKGQIFILSFVIEDTFGDFVIVPHNVDWESVESHAFDSEQSMFPVFNGDTRVVNFSCNKCWRKLYLFVLNWMNVAVEKSKSINLSQQDQEDTGKISHLCRLNIITAIPSKLDTNDEKVNKEIDDTYHSIKLNL